ncbi:peptidase inhibitor family I36 protein [Actinomadura rudentiformis]|uniref:Peptidase inhibitor family I36 protein n=1 Tax=Actinomadura rudentiformis TaxID=359158 RepID=A0A6H9YXY1_9ACTN|nr:peptidase inhibitor family I36 protein [Actinomadura rudentiformis]KAB2352314.1 hypothetical protein F8566_01035 [Actinomadura rudentiformis]
MAVLSSTVLGATSASAETEPAKPSGMHCRVVLDRVQPGEEASRVTSRTCSTDRAELGINAKTLLMTWYEHSNYNGWSTYVEGDWGPCDRVGYKILDTGNTWRNMISSFKVWNSCDNVHAYQETNLKGTNMWYHGNRSYVGDTMNDKIRSIWIQSS